VGIVSTLKVFIRVEIKTVHFSDVMLSMKYANTGSRIVLNGITDWGGNLMNDSSEKKSNENYKIIKDNDEFQWSSEKDITQQIVDFEYIMKKMIEENISYEEAYKILEVSETVQ